MKNQALTRIEYQVSVVVKISFSLDAPSHALACLGIFHAPFLAGLEIDRVLFYLFDNRFLLDSSLESLQCALEGFSLFNNHKCQ